jgi:hypothetical protein
MQFADVKNDIAFRKIFGNETKTEILISFLNAVLKPEGTKQIVWVEILNPYQLPRIADFKTTILDVRAKDQAAISTSWRCRLRTKKDWINASRFTLPEAYNNEPYQFD